ncbi:MAG TPA: VWA domain-containing protein [Kofleriaceae bacterium]|nr:VWA domain-containing protein [Kofleriaceae bacterium]
MKLVAALCVGCSLVAYGGLARATTPGLDEYGAGIERRPATQLREAACELDVDLRGAVATFELRQRIVNTGTQPLAAIHTLALPRGAVVTSLTARGHEPALMVAATSPAIEADTPEVIGVDPTVLRALPDGSHELAIQPIAPGGEVQLVTRYAALATPRAGALELVLPGRGGAGLATCKGTLRALPGPGATVQRIAIAGTTAGTKAAPIVIDASDVVIDVELELPAKQPVVWTQTQPIGDGWNATLVTALAPRITGQSARRVVFVVDGSRSMELVGAARVAKIVRAIGAALPPGSELEAIAYDRTATRLLGKLAPATPQVLADLEAAIARRPAGNGTNLTAAFELARQTLERAPGGVRGQAMIVVITDGVTPELPGTTLVRALGPTSSSVDVHAIVLDPAHTTSPGATLLRAPVNLLGGSYVELDVDHIDGALSAIDEWLRPAWLELALSIPSGPQAIPSELRAGSGFTQLVFHRGAASWKLTGHREAAFAIASKPAPAAPIAALALVAPAADAFAQRADVAKAKQLVERARLAQGPVTEDRMLAVLSSAGRIAKSRRAMVAGGGRYERTVAVADPPQPPPAPVSLPIPASAIARITLERLFRDQLQPKAYACYQRALGLDPKLAGTVRFTLVMGRGEVTDVQLVGLPGAHEAFDRCLLDAAYVLTPPKPDFKINADDQTIANYALTFQRQAEHPIVVAGDADSSSPLDIDAIEGGVPGKIKVDASTPLGGMRPPSP